MSMQHTFLDRRASAHRPRILGRRRAPQLIALALFVALLAAEIALIVRLSPFVDPSSLIYSGT